MQNFWNWLEQVRLLRLLAETYYSFNSKQYNHLFDDELEKVIAIPSPQKNAYQSSEASSCRCTS